MAKPVLLTLDQMKDALAYVSKQAAAMATLLDAQRYHDETELDMAAGAVIDQALLMAATSFPWHIEEIDQAQHAELAWSFNAAYATKRASLQREDWTNRGAA